MNINFYKTNKSYFLIDEVILTAAVLLVAIGIVMVYSASIAYASSEKLVHNQYHYLMRHLGYVALAAICGIFTFKVPTSFWQRNAVPIGVSVVILLILVLIPHIGRVVNGSRRWLGFGILNLQPSELAKLASAIFLSSWVCKKDLNVNHGLMEVMPSLAIIGLSCGLLLLEPDMGSATVVFLIALSILFMGGINQKIIIGLCTTGALLFVALVIAAPYRMKRVLGFINPWQDALGNGYQLTHSLLAIGHGGWLGVGLGNSIEKLFYLPEAHTDFILAIIAEETGVFGVVSVLLLFWLIFYRGFEVIARDAKSLANRKFQSLLAQGISVWFFAQAIVNIGVAIGILPTKGLTLPLVSFGGSSILVTVIALSLLLKIDYENKLIKRGLRIK